jgi:hypothetical protein
MITGGHRRHRRVIAGHHRGDHFLDRMPVAHIAEPYPGTIQGLVLGAQVRGRAAEQTAASRESQHMPALRVTVFIT